MDPKQEKLEERFVDLEKALDNYLEDTFESKFSLHPCRLKRGKGANPIHDGVFSATIIFSMGFGTKSGRGYILNISISTLDRITIEDREEIDDEAFKFVEKSLPLFFPERKLSIVRDGSLMKIVGDFSLS